MTVSIPKPNLKALQEVRDRAANSIARVAGSVRRPTTSAHGRPDETTKADEWSAVMANSAPAPAAATDPAPVPRRAVPLAAAAARLLRRPRREINTSWVLAAMVGLVCALALGW